MKLLLDQDVYEKTRRFLLDSEHELVTASELGMARADDEDLLRQALEDERILVTRDRDFGRLTLGADRAPGILYLRMRPSTIGSVHEELQKVLERYDREDLTSCFIVVEPGRHRIRRRI